jgi:hypothetical protein
MPAPLVILSIDIPLRRMQSTVGDWKPHFFVFKYGMLIAMPRPGLIFNKRSLATSSKMLGRRQIICSKLAEENRQP